MKNNKSRIVAMMMALAMMAGMFAGCGKTADPADPGKPVDPAKPTVEAMPPAKDKDTIIIATMGETPSLTPTGHNAVAGSYMNQLTYNALFETDMELNPVPALVDTFKQIDETTWEFKLKKDVKFHDGSTMTSADVVASIVLAKEAPEINLYNKDIIKIEATDPLTVKITTDGPDAMLLSNLTHHGNAIIPKALIDSGNDFNKNPIGTGPYMFKEWILGDSLRFEAFPDYFKGPAKIKNMTWRIIPEGTARTIALQAHEIDFIVEVEAMDVARIKEDKKLETYEYNSTSVNWLMLNNEKPGLDNQDVRHALNSAIDKEDVVTVAYNGMATPAYSMCPANLPGNSTDNQDTFDVAKAKEYLTKSGVAAADVKFSIICSDDTKKRAGEVVQANLKENLGVECGVETMDLATYLSATSKGDYTASIGGYTADSMLGYVVGVYHSASINSSNKTRTVDKEVDKLIDEAKKTTDEAKRNETLGKLAARLNTLCPQVPLFQPVAVRAFNEQIEGVEVNAGGSLKFENVSWKK